MSLIEKTKVPIIVELGSQFLNGLPETFPYIFTAHIPPIPRLGDRRSEEKHNVEDKKLPQVPVTRMRLNR